MRRFTLLFVMAVAAATLAPSHAGGPAATRRDVPARAESRDLFFDARAVVRPMPGAAAAAARLRSSHRDLQVTWHARTGAVHQMFSAGGFLSPPSRGDAVAIARRWIAANRALFGLRAGTRLDVARNASMPGTSLRPLVFRVVYDGIPTFAGGSIGVNVTRDGRIASAWSESGRDAELDRRATVDAADALEALAKFERSAIRARVRAVAPRPTS